MRHADDAMALLKQQERICRELGYKHGLSNSLGHQAVILRDWGRLDEAMALLKEQERLCNELANPSGLAVSLANQAELLAEKMNRPREALPLVEEAYRLVMDHGLTGLVAEIKPILDLVQSRAAGSLGQ